MGYVPVTVRQLRPRGSPSPCSNLGIPTAVIGRDFQNLGQQYSRTIAGNFIDQEMPFVQRLDAVTIFAGVNEVNTITAALGGGAGGSDPNAYIDAQVRAFGSRLRDAARRHPRPRRLAAHHRAQRPESGGAAVPCRHVARAAAGSAAHRRRMTRTVVNPLASGNLVVVDLMCDARSYMPSNYFSDGLHPNDSGYAFIASEVVRAVTSASYPPPQSQLLGDDARSVVDRRLVR